MTVFNLLINQGSALLLGTTILLGLAKPSNLQAQEMDDNATIEEIAEQETALGEEVTVRGTLEEVEPGISFVLEEENLFGDEEVLIINVSEQIVPQGSEDYRLQVTGEVGSLIFEDVERDYGLDLDPEYYAEYESQPVIFADYMVAAPEIEEVVENPELYYGQEIALEGEIEGVKNDYAFTLKEGQLISGEDLLIINATGQSIPQDEEAVVITGTIRPFVKAEFERDYDLTWDLDVQEEIEAEYTEKPVMVMDSFYPSAQEEGISLFE